LKDQAYELAEILKKTHPDDPKSHSIYADFLSRDCKYKEARDEFRMVIALDSSKYIIWEQLLIMESELSDFTAMAKESKSAMELFPFQPLPYFFAGIASYQLKDYENAINILEKGVKYVIDNKILYVQFYSTLGDAYNQVNNNEASDGAYEKVLKVDPDNAYVLNNYSYFLSLRNEKLDKAEIMSKRACDLNPGSASNLDTHGWVLYKAGKFEQAKEYLEEALSKSGQNSPVILEHYGDVLYKLGKGDKALEYWQKAKSI